MSPLDICRGFKWRKRESVGNQDVIEEIICQFVSSCQMAGVSHPGMLAIKDLFTGILRHWAASTIKNILITIWVFLNDRMDFIIVFFSN